MADFQTIQAATEGFYKEKGSKFIAYAYPVISEEEVRPLVKALKKEYYDARHHCYAFVVGKDKMKFRAADDGEPSNSAGAPILGQIRSLDLTNVLVVVVRYFGGTKLGVPGLINAYREATKDALHNANLVGKYELIEIEISFDYIKMNDVMRLIKDFDIKLLDQGYDSNCTMKLSFKKSEADLVLAKFEETVLGLNEL
jgi:uncharacterized YigZ family protein